MRGSQLLGLLLKKLGQHAVAVGLSAALVAGCLSAGASEVMRCVLSRRHTACNSSRCRQ